jgi:hypothetical protein
VRRCPQRLTMSRLEPNVCGRNVGSKANLRPATPTACWLVQPALYLVAASWPALWMPDTRGRRAARTPRRQRRDQRRGQVEGERGRHGVVQLRSRRRPELVQQHRAGITPARLGDRGVPAGARDLSRAGPPLRRGLRAERPGRGAVRWASRARRWPSTRPRWRSARRPATATSRPARTRAWAAPATPTATSPPPAPTGTTGLDRYTALGSPAADRVRERLAVLR